MDGYHRLTLTEASLPEDRPPSTFTEGDRVRMRLFDGEGPLRAYLVIYADEQIVSFAPVVEAIE